MTFPLTERAQLAMVLEVSAYPKPGNVDRCHDYPDTTLEHFLASAVFVRPAFERAERHQGGIGEIIREATLLTGRHRGGNTHFGAFILLVPLIMGSGIRGASEVVKTTTVDDAVAFYKAFSLTGVRVKETDDLDVNDPGVLQVLRDKGMTLLDVMAHSAGIDMVAREWTNGFSLTRKAADLLTASGPGREAIVSTYLRMLADMPDTFIAKKLGDNVAQSVSRRAGEVLSGDLSIQAFDEECLSLGANPGSTADIIIAAIYTSLGEGWQWESCARASTRS
jgi:triphosphoribosyl-dephospho-CoA synthase